MASRRTPLNARTLSALLQGDETALASLAHSDADDLRNAASAQGVLPLIAAVLRRTGAGTVALRQRLSEDAAQHAAVDLLRERALKEALDHLAVAEIDVLVIKGSALAYTHFERPDLRPRFDTDVLIALSARQSSEIALEQLGYARVGQVRGRLVSHQATLTKDLGSQVTHVIDLHWKIANPHQYADVFTFEELQSRSIPLPKLSNTARTISGPDALLLACLHRLAHHFDDDYLLWLYDIHLIASRFTDSEWRASIERARRHGLISVLRQGLSKTNSYFPTSVPKYLDENHATANTVRERSMRIYLKRDHRQLRILLDDLRSLPRWRDRRRLLREHLFPPAEYMRQVYAPHSAAPLSMLYARRALRGVRKWLAWP